MESVIVKHYNEFKHEDISYGKENCKILDELKPRKQSPSPTRTWISFRTPPFENPKPSEVVQRGKRVLKILEGDGSESWLHFDPN